jgi:hypothetical protein
MMSTIPTLALLLRDDSVGASLLRDDSVGALLLRDDSTLSSIAWYA